jgi:hypothetical protein
VKCEVRPCENAWPASVQGRWGVLIQAAWLTAKMEAVQDTMPAFPLKVNQHRVGMGEIVSGVRRETFHEMSDDAWSNMARQAASTPEDRVILMREAVREAYRRMDLEYGPEEAFDFEEIAAQSLQWFDAISLD